MSKTILLASRDLRLLESRALLLHYAGYDYICAATIETVLAMTRNPHLVLLDHTFTRGEQNRVQAAIEQDGNQTRFVCLNEFMVMPDVLLQMLADQLKSCYGAASGAIVDGMHAAERATPGWANEPASTPPPKRSVAEFGKYEFGGHKYDLPCIYLG